MLLMIEIWDMRLLFLFFFSSRRRHTRFDCDWSSDVCSSDLLPRTPSETCTPGETRTPGETPTPGTAGAPRSAVAQAGASSSRQAGVSSSGSAPPGRPAAGARGDLRGG